jgi:hypothetical protein
MSTFDCDDYRLLHLYGSMSTTCLDCDDNYWLLYRVISRVKTRHLYILYVVAYFIETGMVCMGNRSKTYLKPKRERHVFFFLYCRVGWLLLLLLREDDDDVGVVSSSMASTRSSAD